RVAALLVRDPGCLPWTAGKSEAERQQGQRGSEGPHDEHVLSSRVGDRFPHRETICTEDGTRPARSQHAASLTPEGWSSRRASTATRCCWRRTSPRRTSSRSCAGERAGRSAGREAVWCSGSRAAARQTPTLLSHARPPSSRRLRLPPSRDAPHESPRSERSEMAWP